MIRVLMFFIYVARIIAVCFVCYSTLACTYETSESGSVAEKEESPKMSVNEIPADGYSNSFGGKSQPTDMIMGATNPINALQASWGKASTYTVQFLVNPPSPGPFDPIAGGGTIFGTVATEALVQWSIDGNLITRRVSVANGASLSGQAQGVTVTLIDKSLFFSLAIATKPANFTGKYTITTSVTPGVRASPANPTTLFPIGNRLDAAGNPTEYGSFELVPLPASTFIPIPSDSGATSVQVLAAASTFPGTIAQGQVQVLFFVKYGAAGIIIGGFDPIITGGFVPIPAGATHIEIIARAAGAGGTPSINCQVAFGIDG
jgi:hypothetical protein